MLTCGKCRREYAATYLANGRPHKLCPKCREGARLRSARNCKADPESNARYQQKLRRRYREEAFAAYGGKCACCEENAYEFLTIDHPHGGGRAERELIKVQGGASFARELARRGYPPGYQVLCHNCNSAYGYFGYCPHVKERA